MTGQQIGPYRIIREIGRGGMGSVYEAFQPQIERRVAIKVLRSEYAQNQQLVARFLTESRAVNIVNHPSVVQISEFGQLPDGLAYIVMEYLDGESLGSRMKRQGGRLSIPEALRLLRQIAAALAAAHAKGIIHRDLKPDDAISMRSDGRMRSHLVLGMVAEKLCSPSAANALQLLTQDTLAAERC
jgi:serine/threonine protein kinase